MIATRATPPSRRSLAMLPVLLIASALGTRALGGPRDALVRPIVVGRLPDALALDPATGQAFVAADADATVDVLDLASGQLVRTVRVGDPGADAPLALALDRSTQRVFVANRGDNGIPSVLRVLDSRSGAPLVTLRVGLEASALAVDERAGHAFVATGGHVSVLDARTGALLRTTTVGLAPLALAVDAQTGRVFVGGPVTPDGLDQAAWEHGGAIGRIDVLDSRSGALVRTVRVGSAPVALAVDARAGRVFAVLEDENMVSVLDARTGTLLQTRPLAPTARAFALAPYALAVDAARDRVYVTAWGQVDQTGAATESGRLFVLDARDGALLRTIAVGVAPRAVAVEAGSGRVVVVDNGGAIHVTPGWAERGLRQVAGWLPWLRRLAPPPPEIALLPGTVRVIDAGV